MKRSLLFLVLVSCARAAVAQSAAAVPARIEILAGVNLATFSGDVHTDTRVGLVAGLGLIKPLAPSWSFQPELTYSMKGGERRNLDGNGTDVTFKLDYIEVPLLFRYDLAAQAAVHPFIHGGPAVAFKVGCGREASNSGVHVSISCGEFDDDFKVNDFDIGAMFGGGIAFRQMSHTFTIGIRYNLGLIQALDDGDASNRVLSFVGTFDFPWSK